MTRNTYAISHRGQYSFGKSSAYFQYEDTKNKRLGEGASGGGEGNINTGEKFTSELKGYTLNGQLDIPIKRGLNQVLTVGAEWNHQKLDDPASIRGGANIVWPGLPSASAERSTKTDATITSLFVEDNIEISRDFILTPGVRLDNHSEFGNHWSPALNASWMITPEVTLKGGIARTFKAPNLYQSNPNYLWFTMGNGCPMEYLSVGGGCYVLGNADLEPEISVNKEIGVNYTANGWNAGLTYFHNKYDNKITASDIPAGQGASAYGTAWVMKWENATDAVVSGFEGNLLIPVARKVNWINNFTYMVQNKDKQKHQPLSIIPKYTVNTTLDWQATEKLSFVLTGTFYGKQKPRTLTTRNAAATGNELNVRKAYNLWGISAGYAFDKNWRLRGGVSNLFDKRLYREGNSSSAGAATYNEPGRMYYLTLTASF
jgi:ferric enterobactin receptor